LLVAVAAVVGYRAYIDDQNQTAQQEMFAAVYQFEADSLNKALKGDGNMIGLETIADEYSGTKAGKLANFYIGSIYLKQGKFDQAIQALEAFSSDDILVQARAYCLEGDAYAEKSDYEQAEYYYQKAANYKPNKFFTPGYLMKLAQVYELHNNPKSAAETYDRILKEYYESSEASDARKLRARVEQSLSAN
jgi:TolA-binding protein